MVDSRKPGGASLSIHETALLEAGSSRTVNEGFGMDLRKCILFKILL